MINGIIYSNRDWGVIFLDGICIFIIEPLFSPGPFSLRAGEKRGDPNIKVKNETPLPAQGMGVGGKGHFLYNNQSFNGIV
jgi:hypothetical protein